MPDAQRCPQCGAILPPDSAARLCPQCLLRMALDTETLPYVEPSGSGTEQGTSPQFGPYKVLRLPGRGGMGTVYLAEQQQPIRRLAALKVIKRGMNTRDVIVRFESERQALALMDHTNFARVFDAGSDYDGRPYFAMEYVPGIPITEYCDQNRMTNRERLELFLPVCQAVQHAHHKGIIHRDIKPSNVLVWVHDGVPTPKVIDFGVAKAINQKLIEQSLFTEHGMLIGTPEYMSPEQAGLNGRDVDTTSDIYSLGVVLYELLTGVLPFDPKALRLVGYDEMRRIIREEETPRPMARLDSLGAQATDIAACHRTTPERLKKELRTDLDWITLKAMDKERGRRYSSAAEFAGDIERYLNNEPVIASPPSRLYRIRKFISKNRLQVAAAAAVLAALGVGLVTSTALYFRLEQARLQFEQERALERKLEIVRRDQHPPGPPRGVQPEQLVSEPTETANVVLVQREPLPNFAGTWLQIDPPEKIPQGLPMRLKASQSGTELTVWLSDSDNFGQMPFGQARIQNGKAVWTLGQACTQQFRWAGYDYSNPGVNVFKLELQGSVLIYTQDTVWTSPCDRHPVGTETVVKHLQRRTIALQQGGEKLKKLEQQSGSGGGFGGGAYRIGGGVSAPVPINEPEPEYSEEDRKAKWQGTVLLSLVVDETGKAVGIKVIKSSGLGLDQKAIEAVEKWRFKPA